MNTRKRAASNPPAVSPPVPCRIRGCGERGKLYSNFIEDDGFIGLCHDHAEWCGICGQHLEPCAQLFTWCFFERVLAHRSCVEACTERQYEFSLRHKIAVVRAVTNAWCDKVAVDTECIRISIFDQFLRDWLDAAKAWDSMIPLARTREAARTAAMNIQLRIHKAPDTDTDNSSDLSSSSSSVSLGWSSDSDDDLSSSSLSSSDNDDETSLSSSDDGTSCSSWD